MRPPGVRERIRDVVRDELAVVGSWTDRQLRVRLTGFVDACARLVHHDHPVSTVLDRYRRVDAWLADPDQLRTGTDFEARSLRCVEELRPLIEELAARPVGSVSPDEQDEVWEPLVTLPPRWVLGEDGRGSQFHLVCWNQANSVAEGVQRPYWAANSIAAEGFHQPEDPYGLVQPMIELTERYEDLPDARPGTAAEIVRVLDAYRAVAPWPRTPPAAG